MTIAFLIWCSFSAKAIVSLMTHEQIQCISIGKTATRQLLFLAPSLTLPQSVPALFYGAGKVLVYLRGKKTFFLILLFVGKHLKEIEGLNDKGSAFSAEPYWRIVWRNGPSAGRRPGWGNARVHGCSLVRSLDSGGSKYRKYLK